MYITITTFTNTRNVEIQQEDGTSIYSENFSTTDYELVRNSSTNHFEIVKDNTVYLAVPYQHTIFIKGIDP